MIWWMNREPLSAMVLTAELAALWEGVPSRMGQRAWLIHLDNEFGVPVMAGVVENPRGRLGIVQDPGRAGGRIRRLPGNRFGCWRKLDCLFDPLPQGDPRKWSPGRVPLGPIPQKNHSSLGVGPKKLKAQRRKKAKAQK